MSVKELFQIAMESNEDSEVNQEIEYAFFIKLSPDEVTKIKEKSFFDEIHEQWEFHVSRPDNKKVSIRVRSINDTKYVLCSKLNLPDEAGKREVELPTNKAMFEQFKILGNTGTRKERFKIKAENGLVWEIDVYTDRTGSIHPWVKVDLEVPNEDTPIPPFPFEFDRDEAILTQPLKRTTAEVKKLEELFSEYNLSIYQTKVEM